MDIKGKNIDVSVKVTDKSSYNSNKNENQHNICNPIVIETTGNITVDKLDQPSTSQTLEEKKEKVELFTKVEGPSFYEVTGNVVTDPVIVKNLPKVFQSLPINGKPEDDLQKFLDEKLRGYIGPDIVDEEYEELAKYCSPDHLRTGKELAMNTTHPIPWSMSLNWKEKLIKTRDTPVDLQQLNLHTVKQSLSNYDKDLEPLRCKRLKYRSVRMFPLQPEGDEPMNGEPDLEPGKDMLLHVRIYKPFMFSTQDMTKKRLQRHSLFQYNLIMLGRHPLSMLRDRIVCDNDLEMRVDVSNSPDNLPEPTAKEVFPSGFLFINNVFYVDTREGCVDHSAPIRDWARRRDVGVFQRRDMCNTRLDEIVLRLGYPDVYVHQGACEHIITFSEIRLLNATDPLHSSHYPCHTQASSNQLVNCNTCAEFSAKWLVADCERVPFDPAMFCDTCFRQYLYKDGVKIGDFKAYRFRGNEVNLFKPQV